MLLGSANRHAQLLLARSTLVLECRLDFKQADWRSVRRIQCERSEPHLSGAATGRSAHSIGHRQCEPDSNFRNAGISLAGNDLFNFEARRRVRQHTNRNDSSARADGEALACCRHPSDRCEPVWIHVHTVLRRAGQKVRHDRECLFHGCTPVSNQDGSPTGVNSDRCDGRLTLPISMLVGA